jgi:hypothetical protein
VTLPHPAPFARIRRDSMPAEGMMECVDPAGSSPRPQKSHSGLHRPAAKKQDSADIEAVEGTRATLHFKMSAPMARRLSNSNGTSLAVDGSDLPARSTSSSAGISPNSRHRRSRP